MSGSNFNHTVITSDGAALIRRSKEENKKIVFVKAVSSQKFESLRGDLVHKNKDWFESIEGSVIAVQAVDGVFKLAVSFSQAPSKVTLKSIGILAKLAGETDAQAVVFSAASDDNSQLIVDTSSAVVAFVEDLPAAINASNTDSYGTIPQGGGGGGGGDISGCVASGVYDSTNHNILLKNNVGTVLSTIDCSAFIVDGMVEDVEIENGYLVISFNTDAGKQDISIPLTDIFNPANYYTKTECDNTFLSSADLNDYALKSEIPTATSDLTNDSGFITSADLSTYALKSEIPTATSDLTNDSGFITSSDLSDYALKSEIPTDTSDLNNDSGFITSSDLSAYALKSEIPTDTSDLNNDSGFITSADLSGYAQTADLGGAAYKGVDTSIGGSPTNDNLPTSLAVTTWVGNQGFLTSHQSLAGCVASGEYVSADHNILLKNSSGTVLSTIDASAFIKDGMVDTVAISNGYLIITFNTDSGKQPISIPLSDIFDPSNYYTKTQVDSGFMTTNTAQNVSGTKTWVSAQSGEGETTVNTLGIYGGLTPKMLVEYVVHDDDVDVDTYVERIIANKTGVDLVNNTYTWSTYTKEGVTIPYNPTATLYDVEMKKNKVVVSQTQKATTVDDTGESVEITEDSTVQAGELGVSTLYIKYEVLHSVDDEEPTTTRIKEFTADSNHINISDTATNYTAEVNLERDGLIIDYDGSGDNDISLTHTNGGLVINKYASAANHQASLTIDGLAIDSKILANQTNGFKHQVSSTASSAFASLDHTNGLKLNGGTGTTQLQVTYQAITRGSANYTWNKVPLSFTSAYKNYRIETNENGVGIPHYVPVHIISQIHIKDDDGTLKAAVQVATSGNSGQAWTEYRACARSYHEITNGIAPYLQLHFNASDEIDYVQLNSTYGQFYCEFTLLIPQNGSFVTLRGSLYTDGLTASQFNLTTPIAVVDDELIIAKAVFTPTWFIAVDDGSQPEPEPEP